MENLFLSGYLYLILYRYSQTINNALTKTITLDEVNKFIVELNNQLDFQKMAQEAQANGLWTQLFYLVSLF